MPDFSRDIDIGKYSEQIHKTEVQNLSEVTEKIIENTDVSEEAVEELTKIRIGTEIIIDEEIEL